MKHMTKYIFTAYVLWCADVHWTLFLNQASKYVKSNYRLFREKAFSLEEFLIETWRIRLTVHLDF